jgi:hypothetical protein
MSNIDDDPGGPADRVKPDATPPRNPAIAFYSLLTVAALVGVKFTTDAYLESNTRAVRSGHIDSSVALAELDDYRSEASAALEGGELSIDDAMDQLAERGRAAFVQIRPTSHDTSDAARVGWSSLNAAAPEPAPRATRSVFTLSEEEMPPADPEVEALEAGLVLPSVPAPN